MEPVKTWNRRSSTALALLLLPFLLTGCTTFNALMLPEEKGSAVDNSVLDYGACQKDPSEFESLVEPGVVVSVLFDQAATLAETALQEKKKRFTSTYLAKTTVDELVPGSCLRFVRTAKGQVVSEIQLKVLSRGKNSAELVVHRFRLEAFSASTSPKNGELTANVTVSTAIQYVNPKQFDGPKPITTISLPVASTRFTLGKSSPNSVEGQKSTLFPLLKGTPTNVAISVTEVGEGTSQLKAGLDGFQSNAAALKKILGLDG